MPGRIANESEHRRGLVLGLTLAEVLVLVLFLILLVLGDRLLRAETALAGLKPILNGGKVHPDKLASELAKVKALEKAVSDLKEENARMRTELADKSEKLRAFEGLIAAARAIDPTSPPAVLRACFGLVESGGFPTVCQ